MENKEQDYIIQEINNEYLNRTRELSNYSKTINAEDQPLDACWNLKILSICVEKVSSTETILCIKVSGVKIACIMLDTENTCIKIKETIGGGLASVDVEICANFEAREIRAKGKVCAATICTKFNQRIISW